MTKRNNCNDDANFTKEVCNNIENPGVSTTKSKISKSSKTHKTSKTPKPKL